MSDYENNDPYINSKGEIVYIEKLSLFHSDLLGALYSLESMMGHSEVPAAFFDWVEYKSKLKTVIGEVEISYFETLYTAIWQPEFINQYIGICDRYGMGSEEFDAPDDYIDEVMSLVDEMVEQAENKEPLHKFVESIRLWLNKYDEILHML